MKGLILISKKTGANQYSLSCNKTLYAKNATMKNAAKLNNDFWRESIRVASDKTCLPFALPKNNPKPQFNNERWPAVALAEEFKNV